MSSRSSYVQDNLFDLNANQQSSILCCMSLVSSDIVAHTLRLSLTQFNFDIQFYFRVDNVHHSHIAMINTLDSSHTFLSLRLVCLLDLSSVFDIFTVKRQISSARRTHALYKTTNKLIKKKKKEEEERSWTPYRLHCTRIRLVDMRIETEKSERNKMETTDGNGSGGNNDVLNITAIAQRYDASNAAVTINCNRIRLPVYHRIGSALHALCPHH